MTNLTEQLKKGELPEGHYYVKDGENMIAEYLDGYFYNNGNPMTSFSGGVDEVLAEVPTFEEWQAREKYNKHLEEIIKVYDRKDKQATETSIAYNEMAKENEELKEILERHKKATAKAQIRSCDLEIINAQLKELLKECRDTMNKAGYLFAKIDDVKKAKRLLKRIDEVLK